MAMFNLHLEGLDELRTAFVEWQLRISEAALEFVSQGGEVIADAAKREFIGGGGSPPWNSPSFPKPTSYSGFLRDSIGTDNIRSFPGGASSETGPRTVYGRRIELGYTGHPRGPGHPNGLFPHYTTRAFPYMKPGAEKATPDLQPLFSRLVLTTMEA